MIIMSQPNNENQTCFNCKSAWCIFYEKVTNIHHPPTETHIHTLTDRKNQLPQNSLCNWKRKRKEKEEKCSTKCLFCTQYLTLNIQHRTLFRSVKPETILLSKWDNTCSFFLHVLFPFCLLFSLLPIVVNGGIVTTLLKATSLLKMTKRLGNWPPTFAWNLHIEFLYSF